MTGGRKDKQTDKVIHMYDLIFERATQKDGMEVGDN